MGAPNLPTATAFVDDLFRRLYIKLGEARAALDSAKAQIDAIAPGAADELYAKLVAKYDALATEVSGLHLEVTPERIVRIGIEEAAAALSTGRSVIRQPPTALAG